MNDPIFPRFGGRWRKKRRCDVDHTRNVQLHAAAGKELIADGCSLILADPHFILHRRLGHALKLKDEDVRSDQDEDG